jgi:hypothetical protein
VILAVAEAATELVPNVPVIPDGQFDAVSVTAELKPFAAVTVTVDVAMVPC